MPTDHDLTATERQALAQWLHTPPPPREPDAMALAAWLDGELEEQEAQQVEQWLAADPTLLDALPLTGDDPLDLRWEPVTETEISRAQALVSPQQSQPTHATAYWPVRVWGGVLGGALGLATAMAGLVVGLGLAQVQTQVHTQAETQVVTALIPELVNLPGEW